MIDVVGVRFKSVGKIYYFDGCRLDIKKGDNVVVETSRGVEYGHVVIPKKSVSDDEIVSPLKKVIRVATKEDDKTLEENKLKEKEAFSVCVEKIQAHELEMKLIDVEYTFDHNRILFYFTAEGRVDFRELVRDLASVFKTRIELRQIGVRDEAKMLGGIGICGRPLCCNSYLGEFAPVSIKMAKEQSLSLNPTKISGTCGRLMCCLKNEQAAYEGLLKKTPNVGAIVETPDGKGTVTSVALLKGYVTVSREVNGESYVDEYSVEDVKILKNAYVKEDKETLAELKGLED
ncbi:MAG: stage 0 sporulation protein [Ruminococcaceae bacterium]|nr:stage 0 sporulation protein [Oscillospiraceae bacterium]